MVESIASGAATAPIPVVKPPATNSGRPQQYYADGSAIPDLIAYHHRDEDLGIEGKLNLPDASAGDSNFFGEDGLTFGDVLDIINPLQHIPVIATFYRAITGDEISPGARIAGGALFGGPIGAGLAIVNAAVEEANGQDIGDSVLAALTGEDDTEAQPGLAAASTPTATATSAALADASPVALPARTETAQSAAVSPTAEAAQIAATLPVATGLPYGGMGALPFTRSQEQTNDPVAAILQARAAVPAAGPIAGLGNAVPTRSMPQAAIPNISGKLADRLSALAAQTAAVESNAPAARKPDDDKHEKEGVRDIAGDVKPNPFAPGSQIPETMMTTLDRYQKMKQAEASKISG